jgi:hypothetical protein
MSSQYLRCEYGIHPTTIQKIATDTDKNMLHNAAQCCTVLHNEQCVAQLRTKGSVLLKMEKLLLILISDQQVKGDI